jgi:cytochrome c553
MGAWATAIAVLGGSGLTGAFSQSIQPDAQRAASMRRHYADAVAMHTAIIRGDLAGVTLAAQALTEYTAPPGMPDRSTAHAATIRQAAHDAAEATTIVSAAVSSALMLNACGQCHQLAGVQPAITLRPSPQIGGLVGHMLEHQRAADQIFQGLVTPSDVKWRDGMRAFAAAPLHAADLPVGAQARRTLFQTEERMHRLAGDAAQATEPRTRANYYGMLLAGCADCHSRSKTWGPGF